MDEALLTGRFNVYPDMTRRGMSAKTYRSGTAPGYRQEDGDWLSKEGSSSRPRSVSRSSSRADTCLRRTRSAFDVELFRSQLRLNKSLSRNRFKQELLDLALHPMVRASSARTEPDGSEADNIIDSSCERTDKDNAGQTQRSDFSEACPNNLINGNSEKGSPTKEDNDMVDRYDDDDDDGKSIGGKNHDEDTLRPDLIDENFKTYPEEDTGSIRNDLPDRLSRSTSPIDNVSSPHKTHTKQARRRRSDTGLNMVATRRAGSRKGRQDGAIVINPRRHKTRYDVSSELMEPRRFAIPVRNEAEASSLLCYSSSSSEDEELMGLIGHTPIHHGSKRKGAEGRDRNRGIPSSDCMGSDSEQYDTDFELEEGSEFTLKERKDSASCLNTDFGHLTYEAACLKFQVVPRKRIMRQLATERLKVNYCGLNRLETKALALGLLQNNRLDEVDLASNGMNGPSIAYIADSFEKNIFITKLNLSGNNIEVEGSQALCEMLRYNTWLTHLNLSDCGITDNEIGYLAKGIQENSTVICLNLSKNKLEVHGGRHLGTALIHNNGVECLNLSWNMFRGGGAVAVCNSLQRNRTIKELNLAWNGLGFQGTLAISEALKVNRSLIKLDLSNNRVDWDCSPYLAKALTFNKYLEVLELGYNPISMEGCMKLLEAVDRPSSSIRFISLMEIPINNKIAFKATEISKKREFGLEHGGIISTHDIFGVKRIKREDPLTLLIRYLSTMGIRVVDLFRVFDTNRKLYVSQANFIRGLKRVRAPLDEEDMLRVARRMRSDKRGDISYQELAANVRSHIREERKEEFRLQRLENKKRQEHQRILQSDLPLYAPPSLAYLPALYNMYDSKVFDRHLDGISPITPKYSGMDSVVSRRGKTSSGSFLPRMETPGSFNSSPLRRDAEASNHLLRSAMDRNMTGEFGSRSPLTLVRHGTKGIPDIRRPVHTVSTEPQRQDKGVNTSPVGKKSRTKVVSSIPQNLNISRKRTSRSPKHLSSNSPGSKDKGTSLSPMSLGSNSPNSKGKGNSPKSVDQDQMEIAERKRDSLLPNKLPSIGLSNSVATGDMSKDLSVELETKHGGAPRSMSSGKSRDARSRLLEYSDGNLGL